MKVLIIEDEPFAQEELRRLLQNIDGQIEIVEMIDSVEDSIEWLQLNEAPDLIFLDIQLADGLSFDIFKKTRVQSPVIFTTAYDQYAIKAFELNSIDYLLKPVEIKNLRKAYEKYKNIKAQFSGKAQEMVNISRSQLEGLLERTKKEFKSRFVVRTGNLIRHITTNDIAYFYAEDNVVFLITNNNERHIVEYSIEEISKALNPKEFFRLNRAFVTSINAINKVHKYINSRLKLELKPKCEKEAIISRKRVNDFLEWMDDKD